jgi:hypothetical protein
MLEVCSRPATGVPPDCCCPILEAVRRLELVNVGQGTCVLADEGAHGFVAADSCEMDDR